MEYMTSGIGSMIEPGNCDYNCTFDNFFPSLFGRPLNEPSGIV